MAEGSRPIASRKCHPRAGTTTETALGAQCNTLCGTELHHGRGGIRTRERLSPPHAFQAPPLPRLS